MTRHVTMTLEAAQDLADQMSYIAAEDRRGARLVRDRILATIRLLAEKPIGRQGRVPGTYEKHVVRTNYVIAYELPDERRLHVLRIIHTSRNWPAGEWPED